jgi:hypothetical protein
VLFGANSGARKMPCDSPFFSSDRWDDEIVVTMPGTSYTVTY